MKRIFDIIEYICDICAYITIYLIIVSIVDMVIERAEAAIYLEYVQFILWFGAGILSYKVNKLLQIKLS